MKLTLHNPRSEPPKMNLLKKVLITPRLTPSIRGIHSSTTNRAQNEPEPKLVYIVNRERSLNSVTLIGRVGRDPTITEREKTVKQGESEETKETVKVSVFSLATSEYSGVDEAGQAKFRVDWHRVVVTAERAQNLVQKYIRKGDRIHVTGRLHYNMTRDKNGESKLVTSIVADDFIFLSKNIDPDV